MRMDKGRERKREIGIFREREWGVAGVGVLSHKVPPPLLPRALSSMVSS